MRAYRFWWGTTAVFLTITLLFGCQPEPQTAVIQPTNQPTSQPFNQPTRQPANQPTTQPTSSPTALPTETAVFTPIPPISFSFPINPELQAVADQLGVPLVQLSSNDTGRWQFEEGLFPHPIGIEQMGETVVLIDSGRVLQISLDAPTEQRVLLQPDDLVENVPVVEPLSIAQSGEALLVLDRAGDIFAYDSDSGWRVLWYGRSLENATGHYYVGLGADAQNWVLVESSYHYTQRLGNAPRTWPLSAQLGVDAAEESGQTYLLQQAITSTVGLLVRYENAVVDTTFTPTVPLERVRGVAVSETAVYVLDWGGQRLLQLDKTGQLTQLWQTPPSTTAFWAGADDALIFAAPDALYFVELPEQTAVFPNNVPSVEPNPFTVASMAQRDWVRPIAGTQLTERSLQMPGAPRHYRLGVHEGLDFYWRTGTAVRAVADGVVIRADIEYERPERAVFDAQKTAVDALGTTPPDALDFYRGRQVWLEHADGTVTRYAHLSEIAEGVGVGTAVLQGQTIGAVGNSGSPLSVNSDNQDAHLHLEIWQNDHYLGQHLRPVETWELILALWKNHN